MKPEVIPERNRSMARLIVLLVCAFAALEVVGHAQSGRRLPNKTDAPPEVSSTKPAEPAEKAPAKPNKPSMQLVVARDQGINFQSYYSDIVVRSCLDRLKEITSASVSSGRDMNRKEASDLAKNSTDTQVLLLEWASDSMGGSQTSDPYQSNGYINYTLFTAGTGKVKTSGRVYQRDFRNRTGVGGVGIPLPVPNSGAAAELTLKECGREIAKRVADSLNISRPGH